MRTTWADWKTDDMQDAAESAARSGFDALGATMRHFVETLPYYGAYSEYEEHVAVCAHCQRDEFTDCPKGAALFSVARIGLGEQQRFAARN